MGDKYSRRSGKNDDDPSKRGSTHRDRDRILYSEAFRRLGGVTQVALGTPDMILHNRLTHSLKVEQVGLSIFSKLDGDEALDGVADHYAIAAACLAHDLGHPPFGHAGEQELHRIVVCDKHLKAPRPSAERALDPCGDCLLEDGFEGNAQSFRILTALEVHKEATSTDPLGLDLTFATLRAVSKYPWARGDHPTKKNKWGAYDCDIQTLRDVVGNDTDQTLSLDAQIMDWADDISYAVHDIEDFYRTNHIPLEQYQKESQALADFLEYAQSEGAAGPAEPEAIVVLNRLLWVFPKSQFSGSADDFAELDNARGTLLTQFINAATVKAGELALDPVQKKVNAIVKQFIWYHVIDGPRLTNIQTGQRRVLREIFDAMREQAEHAFKVNESGDLNERELRRLPHALRRAIEVGMNQRYGYSSKAQKVHRGLLDYIAGLSDADAYHQHAVLKGREPMGHL